MHVLQWGCALLAFQLFNKEGGSRVRVEYSGLNSRLVELIYSGLNYRFDICVTFMTNYFFSGR
jgi:hypothetical protein